MFGGQSVAAGRCPRTLTLGSPVRRAGELPVWLLDFLGESITQDGTRCAGGKLVVIRTLGLFVSSFRSRHGLERILGLFNGTNAEHHLLEWSDSVAFGLDSWNCGRIPAWDAAAVMLFGSDGATVKRVAGATRVVMDDRRPHAMIVSGGRLLCILRGAAPPAGASGPAGGGSLPASGGGGQASGGGGGGGGLSAGPIAGIAVGVGVASVAAVVAAALGYRRWAAARGGNNGNDGGSGGGGGGGGGNGGGGVPPRRGSAATSAWGPWPPSSRLSTTGPAGGRPATGGGALSPYPPAGRPPVSRASAAAPQSAAMATPGPAPSIPSGLLDSWEMETHDAERHRRARG